MKKPDIRILVGTEGGFSVNGESAKLIRKELQSVLGQMKGDMAPRVRVAVNFTETKKLFQEQLQAIANGLDITASVKTKIRNAAENNQIFDTAQLEAEGRRYYKATTDVLERAKEDLSALGKVDITNVFKSPQGEIQSFTATIRDADTVVESFRFKLKQLREGTTSFDGFVQMGSLLSDKTAGTGLEQALDYFTRIKTKLSDLTSKTLMSGSKVLLPEMKEYEQYNNKLQAVKDRIEEVRTSNSTLSRDHKREINAMVADLQRYARELQTSAYAGGELKTQTFEAKRAQLQADLKNSIKQWQTSGVFGGDFEREVENARAILNNATDSAGLDVYLQKVRLLKAEFRGINLDNSAWDKLIKANTLDTQISTTQQKIQNLKSTYSAFVGDPTLVKEWQSLFDQSQIVRSEKELSNLNAKINEFEQKLISAGKHGNSFFNQIAQNFQKMAQWMLMGTLIGSITRGIRGIYDAVVDVDTAMTELRKVTSATVAQYDQFLKSTADRAVDIGAGLPDLIEATANFARLGDYSLQAAEQLGEIATVYANVGDEINSVDDATQSIISTMKAFKIAEDDAETIIDKFNEVGNRTPISSGGIGEALQRSASSLALANNTLDESIGLIVAANNVVQDPDAVGTMWKTVTMRIRGAKTELEDAGLETEGIVESTAKLRELVAGLTNVKGGGGLDIMADDSTFKSTYEIIEGISKVWADMEDVDQAALLELLAGKRQGNALASTITNFTDAQKAMQISLTSAGSAMAEHSKWLDSIEAKQQRFSAQYSDFAQSILDSDLVKGTFEAGTGLLGWLTSIVETVGALPPLVSALYGIHSLASDKAFFKIDTDKDWGGSGIGITTALSAGKRATAEFAAQIETDYQCLLKWERSVNSGRIAIEDFNIAMAGASSEAKTYAATTKGATGSATAFKVSQDAVAASSVKAGIAAKAASVGVQALNLAMNMLLSFGVALAFQAIVSGIDHLANASVRASEKAKEALNKCSDAYAAAESEIDALNNELENVLNHIQELDRLSKTGSLTPDQTDELEDLKEANKELQRKLDLQNALKRQAEEDAEEAALDAYSKATYNVDVGAGGYSYQGGWQRLQGVDALNAYTKAIQETEDAIDKLGNQYNISSEGGLRNYQEKLTLLENRLKELTSAATTCASDHQTFAESIRSTDGEAFELKETILAAVDAYLALTQSADTASSAVANSVPNYEIDLSKFVESFDAAQEKVAKLMKLQSDLKDNGALTADFMAALYEALPDAAGKVTSLVGAQEYLTSAIQDTKEEVETAYVAMIMANEEWLEKSLNSSDTLSSVVAAYCGQDLENWQDLANAKWKVDQQLVSELSALWAEWMNVSTADIKSRINAIEAGMKAGRYINAATAELYNELKTVYELRRGLEGKFEELHFNTSAAKEVELYTADINKLYDTERRLFDLQKKYDLIEARRDLLDEDDFESQLKAADELTRSLREQNEILHEQNNLRDGMIQAEVARIEKLFADQGINFDIDYDPLDNRLNIKDWEKVNQLQAGTIEETNELIKTTDDALKQLVEWNEANVDNSLQWYKNLENIDDILDDIKSTMQETLDDQHKSLAELLELVIKRIKQEKEDEKDALEKQSDIYAELIEQRKQMLQIARQEQSYTDSIAEKTERLAEIEKRLATLSHDNSREARLEEGALREEQKELSKALADEQNEHFVSSAENALDAELDAYESTQQKKLDEIDDFLSDNEKLHTEAITRLDRMGETLYADLLSHAKRYTDMAGDKFDKMWSDAMAAAKEYGDYTSALSETSKEVDKVAVAKAQASTLVDMMKTNANNWTPGDPNNLAAENVELAAKIESKLNEVGLGVNITRDHNGVWWIDGEKLFEHKFHGGTSAVGGFPTRKQNETFALLENSEMVLTQKHQDNLWKMISAWAPITSLNSSLPNFSIAQRSAPTMMGSANITIEPHFYLTGNVDDATLRAMKKYKNELSEIVSEQLRKL